MLCKMSCGIYSQCLKAVRYNFLYDVARMRTISTQMLYTRLK